MAYAACMQFHIYGILETDSSSKQILNYFPAQVMVQVDQERRQIRLEPVAGWAQIPLQESIDRPELPLRQGSMTIGGCQVELIFLGRTSGDGSRGREENLIYALKNEGEAETLRSVIGD